MANSPSASAPSPNQLLARLAPADFQPLLRHLQTVSLEFKQVLYEPRAPIDRVYFPTRGVISAVTIMRDGTNIEVATVGSEGMVGLTAFLGAEESPNRMIVQVPGEALRLEVKALRMAAGDGSPLHWLLARYGNAFHFQVSQGVACNGLHKIEQRCCKWVLMTHDRAGGNEFPLTHEFLSHMLGVRRVSVTEVLKPLQAAGLIRNRRGNIAVLDRKGLEAAACECYQNVRDEFARLLDGGGRPTAELGDEGKGDRPVRRKKETRPARE